MPTWTTIPDSSLEPGKPLRSIDALALRDNPLAIAEGAPGAPRVQLPAVVDTLAAIAVGSVGSYAMLIPNNTTTYGPGSIAAGSSLRYADARATGRYPDFDNPGILRTVGLGATPTGTWRCMGYAVYPAPAASGVAAISGGTLWIRIA